MMVKWSLEALCVLPYCSQIMSGELTLPNFWVGVVGKEHRSYTVCHDSCFFQFFMISPDVIQG